MNNGAVAPVIAEAKFMLGTKFNIVGYPADKRITNIIRFLTEHGGAIYKEKLDPNDIDIIVVSTPC